ncbi:MAG: hypothetical protein RJA25_869 [Bacteroidota bacterium]|jgi:VanZ family protein
MKNKINIKYYLPAIVWSAFIFFVCFIPGGKLPKENWLDKIYFDKIVHAGLYIVLFFLLVRIPPNPNKKVIIIASFICIAQGILIEFIQGTSLISNRTFDVLDIAANIVGVLIAISIFLKKA